MRSTAVTVALKLLVLAALASFTRSGTIIIGGDDFPDHGAYDPVDQEYKRGWKFVLKAANLTYRTSDHPRSNGDLAILGAYEVVNNTELHDPGNCYWWVCYTLGLNCTFIDGPNSISDYLDNVADGTEVPAVLVIGGDQYTDNNLKKDEEEAIQEKYEVLRDYASDGGSILSHANDYQWLTDVTGIKAFPDCTAENAVLTDDGRSMFFQGLLDSDIDAGNRSDEDVGNADAQCHYTFENVNDTIFQPLTLDNLDRPFVLMSFGSIERMSVVRLNCTRQTQFAGTWRIELSNVFDISFDVAANVVGQDFEIILANEVDATFSSLGCEVGIENDDFRAVCPQEIQLNETTVTFEPFSNQDLTGASDANFTGIFSGFAINSIGCPVPPCQTCENADPARVCSQYGDEYASECEFYRLRCLFPSYNIRIVPCPGETPAPTPLPTAHPTPISTANPTTAPTVAPTPISTLSPTLLPTAAPTPVPVPCDEHTLPGWTHDFGCCTVDNQCAAGEGSCTEDGACFADLFCGEDNCPSGFGFPEGARCCEAPCNNHTIDGWSYDPVCCLRDGTSPCPSGEGGCSRDNDCEGSLVCGATGESCDSAFFPDTARCCVASCADHQGANWEYDEECCTIDNPCPPNEGGCTDDDDCMGELECVAGTCPAGFDFPVGASCCEVPCTAYELDGWTYDEQCCADRMSSGEPSCGIGEGGCEEHDQCEGSLICGMEGSCDPSFYEDDHKCCVASCADHLATGWVYNATCCSAASPCPIDEGGCSLDVDCMGDLVCGDAGGCPAEFDDHTDARCCEISCRAWATPGFEYDVDCCTRAEPCDHGEGGCSADDECSGTAFCGTDNCPFGVPGLGPDPPRCCQDLCEWGRDLNSTHHDAPRLTELTTRILFTDINETAVGAFFTTEILIAKPYEEEEISFVGATDPEATYVTDGLNEYWSVDTTSDPCYDIFVALIPWIKFRDSVGGVAVNLEEDTVTYVVDIEATARDIFEDSGLSIYRNVSTSFMFQVSFALTHPINGNVTNIDTALNVTAVLTDASIIRLLPEDEDGLFAEAQLVMVTAVSSPFVLRPLLANDTSVIVDTPSLRHGLAIEEIDRNAALCTATGDFCQQTWRIPFNPETCALSGVFTVFLEGVCHDDAPNCALPRSPTANITLTVSSGSICGRVDVINVQGRLQLPQSEVTCNGPVSGSVFSWSTAGAPLASSTIDRLQVSYPTGAATPVIIYDDSSNVTAASFVTAQETPDTVNFTFLWDATILQCDTLSTLSLVIRVDYEATQLLEDIPLANSGAMQLPAAAHVTKKGPSKRGLLQSIDSETVGIERQISILPANPGGSPNAVAGSGVSGGTRSVLPTWAAVLIALLVVTCCCCAACIGLFLWRTRKHLFADDNEQELCDTDMTVTDVAAAASVHEVVASDDDSPVVATKVASQHPAPPLKKKKPRKLHIVSVYESDSDDSDTVDSFRQSERGVDYGRGDAVEMVETGYTEQTEMTEDQFDQGGLDLNTQRALDTTVTGIETLLSEDLSSIPTRVRGISESQWSEAPLSIEAASICDAARTSDPEVDSQPVRLAIGNISMPEEVERTQSPSVTISPPMTVERIKSPPLRVLKQPRTSLLQPTSVRASPAVRPGPHSSSSRSTSPKPPPSPRAGSAAPALHLTTPIRRPARPTSPMQQIAHKPLPPISSTPKPPIGGLGRKPPPSPPPPRTFSPSSAHLSTPPPPPRSPFHQGKHGGKPPPSPFEQEHSPSVPSEYTEGNCEYAHPKQENAVGVPTWSPTALVYLAQEPHPQLKSTAGGADRPKRSHRRQAPIADSSIGAHAIEGEFADPNDEIDVNVLHAQAPRPKGHSRSHRRQVPIAIACGSSELDVGSSTDFYDADMDISANDMSCSERDDHYSYMDDDDDQPAI